MKKYLLIILLIITTNLFAQQNGVVKYEFSYKIFTDTPKNKMIADARRMADMSAEYAKNHQYILKFTHLESIYHIEDSMPLDDVNIFEYKFSKFIFSTGIYYQNRETGKTLNEKSSMGKNYLVHDSLNSDWKVTTESKYIGKYKCFKAVSLCSSCSNNQEITAWFTPEIPVPYGPAGYGGLPGLILEVSKFRYTLSLKKLKLSNKNISIEKPTKGTLITADKLKELQWEKRMEMKSNRG